MSGAERDAALAKALAGLRSRRIASGGFAASPRHPDFDRPDATAWAILALSLHGAPASELQQPRASLVRFQQPGGAVVEVRGSQSIVWPTPLAVLAWHGAAERRHEELAAVGFLRASGGVPLPRTPELGHDSTLIGWPWILGTHSWVEPTALGLCALRVVGSGGDPRAVEARRLLWDRCLPAGGWNYGNTIAFGTELDPSPDATGVALSALAGESASDPGSCVERSLGWLERVVPTLRSPLGLGWALLALSAWNRRPTTAVEWVTETLSMEQRRGPYDTSLLALLLVSAAAERGLLAALAD